MIAHRAETGDTPSLAALADQLLGFVRHAADQGCPAHDVERAVWDRVLKLGREAFARSTRAEHAGRLRRRRDSPTAVALCRAIAADRNRHREPPYNRRHRHGFQALRNSPTRFVSRIRGSALVK